MASNPPARVLPYQAVHYIENTLTFDSGVVTIGTLPAGAVILRAISGAQVNALISGLDALGP